MAKNSYKANVNQYANQEEAIRKAKGNPNKNIHSKKKNSNYGGYTTGAYMAQKVAEKVNQQEKVKLPTWLNVTLIAEFAVVLVILILRLTAFKDSAVMTHLSSLTLGITCGTLFYIREENQRHVQHHHHSAGGHVPAVHHLRHSGPAGLFGLSAPRRKAQTFRREKGAELWLS